MTSDWVGATGPLRSSPRSTRRCDSAAVKNIIFSDDSSGLDELTGGCGPARACGGEGGWRRTCSHAARSHAMVTALCPIIFQLLLSAQPACGGAGVGAASPRLSGDGRMVILRGGGEESSSEFNPSDHIGKTFTWRDMSRIMHKEGWADKDAVEAARGKIEFERLAQPEVFLKDLLDGEDLKAFETRYRGSKPDMTDDEFLFHFYEEFWPQYKAKKREHARLRGEPLRAKYARVFDQEEAVPPYIPYSPTLRKELGEHRTVRECISAREPVAPPQVRPHLQPARAQRVLRFCGLQDASRSAQHALWAACQLGADDEVIFGLAKHADVDAVCVEYLNYTALHIAAEAGQTSVVECLVALDADLRAVDSEGSTALEVARERRHTLAAEAIEAGGIEWLPKVLRKRDPRHPKKERMTFNQRVAVEVLGSASLEQKRW